MTTNISRQPLDTATVYVEYEYTAAEPDVGAGAKVDITSVYIGPDLVDPSYFAEATLTRWAEAIAVEVAEEAQMLSEED